MHKVLSVVLLFMVLGCGLAYADASADVDSYIDWSTLTIVDGGSAGFTWGSETWQKYDAAITNATNNYYPAEPNPGYNPQKDTSANNWNGVSSTNSVTGATGYGYTTSGGLLAAEPYAFANGVATTDASASASTHRRGHFSVSNDADLTFNIAYNFNHLLGTSDPGEWSSAYSQAALFLWDPQGDSYPYLDMDITGVSGSLIKDYGGTLSVDGHFLAGVDYSIEAHLYSSAAVHSPQVNPVPEPVSTALFLLGGATLAVRRLRRK